MRIVLTLVAILAGFGAQAFVPERAAGSEAGLPAIVAPYEAPVLRVFAPLKKSGWDCADPVEV